MNDAVALHCTSEMEASQLKGYPINSQPFIVPNSIDIDKFVKLPPRGKLRSRFDIPDEAQVLLFLGRLHTKKRPDLAVEALAATQSLPGEIQTVWGEYLVGKILFLNYGEGIV